MLFADNDFLANPVLGEVNPVGNLIRFIAGDTENC
jgi:hypothetical protein